MSEVAQAFRSALRSQAATVCLVVVRTDGGPRGMTATAVISLSVEPPTLGMAINRTASLNPELKVGAPVTILFLAEGQGAVARAFAGGLAPEHRFSTGRWADHTDGAPSLTGACATFRGVVADRAELDTHSFVSVRVTEAEADTATRPLVFAAGAFATLAPEPGRAA